MRFGVTAFDQKFLAEERRQSRRAMADDDGLTSLPPVSVEDLNGPDAGGTNRSVFVLGLHDPFDTNTPRRFSGG